MANQEMTPHGVVGVSEAVRGVTIAGTRGLLPVGATVLLIQKET
jgi:hypothetical protein